MGDHRNFTKFFQLGQNQQWITSLREKIFIELQRNQISLLSRLVNFLCILLRDRDFFFFFNDWLRTLVGKTF